VTKGEKTRLISSAEEERSRAKQSLKLYNKITKANSLAASLRAKEHHVAMSGDAAIRDATPPRLWSKNRGNDTSTNITMHKHNILIKNYGSAATSLYDRRP